MHKKFTSFSELSDALTGLSVNEPYKTVSFDIFDTLLHRRMSPDLVLLGVARHLGKLIVEHGHEPVSDLMQARHDAYMGIAIPFEKQGLDPDLTLDELAPAWVRHAIAGDPSDDVIAEITDLIVATEVEYEQRVCYPNPWLRNALAELKDKGFRLICISDMYLGVRYVEFLLNAAGLREFFSEIYVSGDVRLLKRSGRLFDYVAEEASHDKACWLHIGDNTIADGLQPRKHGIHSWVINDNELHGAYRLQKYDRRLVGNLPGWYGVIAATYAQARPDELLSEVEAYGQRVFGPVYASFVHRVVERCREENVGRVFFFAREGQVLKHLYKEFAILAYPNGGAPQAVYLGISRLTVFIAAMHGYGLRQVTAAIANTGHYSVRTLFSPLRIDEKMLSRLAANNGIDDIDAALGADFLHWPPLHHLVDDPEMRACVTEKAEVMHELLSEYLRQCGFFDYHKIAVVDVGWSGQIQDNLYSSVRSEKGCPEILGLYLGSTEHASARSCPRSRIEALLADRREAGWSADSIFEFVFAYEAASRAPHGTTIGYKRINSGNGEFIVPEFRQDSVLSRQAEMKDDGFVALLQSGIRQYAERYAECARMLCFSAEETMPYARSMVERMIRYPDKHEAQWWLGVNNVSDLGSEEVLSFGDAGDVSNKLRALIKLKPLLRKVFWRYGLLGLLGGRYLQFLFSVANTLRALPHRGFNSGSNGVQQKKQVIAVNQIGENLNRPSEQEFEPEIELAHQGLVDMAGPIYREINGFTHTSSLTVRELWPQFVAYKLVRSICKFRKMPIIPYDGISLRGLIKRELYARYEVDKPIGYLKAFPTIWRIARILKR